MRTGGQPSFAQKISLLVRAMPLRRNSLPNITTKAVIAGNRNRQIKFGSSPRFERFRRQRSHYAGDTIRFNSDYLYE